MAIHEAYFGDPTITEADLYYLADAPNAARHRHFGTFRDPVSPQRIIPWGVTPRNLDLGKILKLCVDHDDPAVVDLPGLISELPNLRWLEIPTRFVARLTSEFIPPSTQTLRITKDDKITLPKTLVLPWLRRLQLVDFATLKFRAEQLPAIRQLGLKLDIGGVVLRELARVPDLEGLSVGPIRRASDLESLLQHPLRFFHPLSGFVDTIEPIRACPSLTNLWLDSLSRVTSLVPLNDLPDLRELSVAHCFRVKLDPSFAHLPALRRLWFAGNRDIGLTAIRPLLDARGLDEFTSYATY